MMTAIPATDVGGILDYLRRRVALPVPKARAGWAYPTDGHYLLEHGRPLVGGELTAAEARIVATAAARIQAIPQQCYANAATAVLGDRTGRFVYVEGYAQCPQVPGLAIAHAWVELDGKLFDPTWESRAPLGDRMELRGPVPDGYVYFGAPFTREEVRFQRTTPMATILNDWNGRFPILRTGRVIQGQAEGWT